MSCYRESEVWNPVKMACRDSEKFWNWNPVKLACEDSRQFGFSIVFFFRIPLFGIPLVDILGFLAGILVNFLMEIPQLWFGSIGFPAGILDSFFFRIPLFGIPLQSRMQSYVSNTHSFRMKLNETEWNWMKLNETEWNWMKPSFQEWNCTRLKSVSFKKHVNGMKSRRMNFILDHVIKNEFHSEWNVS